jgi:uncharacterized RDD family membrane protein YckC
MTQTIDAYLPPLRGLPDPDFDARFYEGVPSRRLVAWLVDFLVVAAISLVVIPIFGILTLGLGFFAAPAVYWSLSFLYRVATLSGRSATWGMQLMGIELRSANGERFGFGMAVAHVGLYSLSVFLTVPLFLSALAVLATRYKQTVHDILLRSAAINVPED